MLYVDFFIDFFLVAIFVIGITATMGVIANGVGTTIFGKRKNESVEQSLKTQAGWKKIGGRK